MTRISRFATVGLLVLSLVGGAVGPVAGQTGPQVESADLAVTQPHYVDEDVHQSTSNGTIIYQAGAAPLEIAPQNFDARDVVDFGVETQGGNAELTYNRDFGQFEFSADADGTYELYWSVERRIEVQNESGNGTHIETRGQRYTALIRLSGLTEMVHQPASEMTQTREDAAKWQEWNATIADVQETIGTSLPVKLGLAQPPSAEETMQGMVNAYLTFRAPLHMLTGNYTQILTLVTMTLGGWLFVATVIVPLLLVIAGLAYRSNRFETTEADEGKLSQRLGEQQRKEDLEKLANASHNDIWEGDDYMAGAMRDLGDDPLVAISNLFSEISPRLAIHARLQAMDAAGWTAVVTKRASTDGGDDEAGTILEAEVQRQRTVDDDAETASLAVEPDDELLDAIDWNQQEIWQEFDLADAGIDPTDMSDTAVQTYELEDVVEKTDLDMQKFDDEMNAAQGVVELLEYVREHNVTDEHGEIDGLRYYLEHQLRAANVVEDRFHLPVDAYRDLFELAILQHDAGAEAEQTLQDIRDGAYA
ncbi:MULTISPECIES: hypothetical protein [Halolamina]|uniref:Uncharacterized protein n=1 Tax=Halolamina pelagica TaxID=699431 RepID=A0A1I5VR42_9EURY|nr:MULTISPECIES: hypothetical protein [Halolamina]NHX37818.1 hypothetical protein [Halolamina sp. R1-12]SFQ09883.1 hypothetical protein SAMN05216277_11935 [Halolamina pelagica]